jgi:SAM-dependent methyltransferase
MNDMDIILKRVAAGELISAVVSSPRDKAQSIKKINIRPVMIRQQLVYQCTNHCQSKVIHENLDAHRCGEWFKKAFEEYLQGVLNFEDVDYHILVSKKRQITVVKKSPKLKQALDIVHNRVKNHVLVEGQPVPFLVELGVMTANGKVIAKKYDKFRQINRFLEMVRDITSHLAKDRVLQIIDFGCGKAYLTFALYHYLHHIEGRKIAIKGLDLKKDVIEHCQALSKRLSYSELQFAVGDIKDHQPAGKVDLMVSLHACDVATDAALEKAVRWDADVILCVPCCQHELYKQVKQPVCETLFRHGILKERFAALATDAVRADILTMFGYDVQLLEFIDMEHTPKNLLIRAVKGCSEQNRQEAGKRYKQFKELLQITPCLEKLLLMS